MREWGGGGIFYPSQEGQKAVTVNEGKERWHLKAMTTLYGELEPNMQDLSFIQNKLEYI